MQKHVDLPQENDFLKALTWMFYAMIVAATCP
jgi:hypothetical protein